MPLDEVHKTLELYRIKRPDEGPLPTVQQFQEMEKMNSPGSLWFAWCESLDPKRGRAEVEYQKHMAMEYRRFRGVREEIRLQLSWDQTLATVELSTTMLGVYLRHLWGQLYERGWRGRWEGGREIFTRPGCPDNAKRDGQEGFDYFLEMDDLVRYVLFVRPDFCGKLQTAEAPPDMAAAAEAGAEGAEAATPEAPVQ